MHSQVEHMRSSVEAAVDCSERLAHSTLAERADWLRAVAEALDAADAELVPLADEESGLGEARLRGELLRTTDQLRFFADIVTEGSYLEVVIDNANPHLVPPTPDLRRYLRAIGPVAVYAASNFPFAFSVLGGDTASAIAAGCPVVVKAHPGHPRLSRRTYELARSALEFAGAPPATLGLVEGFEAGVGLIQASGINAAAFTGSLAGGRALHDLAVARPAPIPFYGELGSLNPVVVTAAADQERGEALARGLAQSFQLGHGQFCTKPGLVFVPTGSQLEKVINGFVSGDEGRLLTESITHQFRNGISVLKAQAGIEVVAGGTDDSLAPTVLAIDIHDAINHPELLHTEVFGPVTLLVRYGSDDDLAAALDAVGGSLTATLHCTEDERLTGLVARLEKIAGRVLFAGWPTGVAVTWAQHHGGPWPATTSPFTSVGATSIRRFLRPVVYQDAPQNYLPAALLDDNPLGIWRRVNGEWSAPDGRPGRE